MLNDNSRHGQFPGICDNSIFCDNAIFTCAENPFSWLRIWTDPILRDNIDIYGYLE